MMWLNAAFRHLILRPVSALSRDLWDYRAGLIDGDKGGSQRNEILKGQILTVGYAQAICRAVGRLF